MQVWWIQSHQPIHIGQFLKECWCCEFLRVLYSNMVYWHCEMHQLLWWDTSPLFLAFEFNFEASWQVYYGWKLWNKCSKSSDKLPNCSQVKGDGKIRFEASLLSFGESNIVVRVWIFLLDSQIPPPRWVHFKLAAFWNL